MKRTKIFGLAVLGWFGFVAEKPALGQTLPLFVTKAPLYDTWMARAFDPCTPSTLTVLTTGLPSGGGCLAANSVTEPTLPMNFARLRVSKSGKIGIFGRGFTFGESVRVRLNLRVTRKGVSTKHPPKTGATVTFADFSVDCPAAPNAFVVRPSGAILGRTDLAACLSPNSGLAGGATPNLANIEVLGASLVNVSSGKELARSGILR